MRRLLLPCLCLLLPLAPLSGCKDDPEDEAVGDGDGDSTGDGDGDPTGDGDGDPTGDGDGDPTGDGDGDGEPPAECESASDCALVNDCCSCAAVLVGEEPPCDVRDCFALTCTETFGDDYVPEADCLLGTCTFAPLSCISSQITCDVIPPPACEDGLVRSVVDNCYGPCIPADYCAELLGGCDVGTCGEGYVCMTSQSGATNRCIPLAPGCEGEPSCECLEPWWGGICNGSCSYGGGILLCEDGG